MAANPSVTNVFQPNTIAESGAVNQNFNDLISWLSANAMQRDGSTSFTNIPTLPPVNPTNANHAVRKAYVDQVVIDSASVVLPAGMIVDFIGAEEPTGWALMNGQTLINAESQHPNLWANAPVSWRSGSNMVLPNMATRVTVGKSSEGTFSTLGATGGSVDAVVVSHGHAVTGTISLSGNLPLSGTAPVTGSGSLSGDMALAGGHSHTVGSAGDHSHTAGTNITGGHSHTPSTLAFVVQSLSGGTGAVTTTGSSTTRSAADTVSSTNTAGSHSHTVTVGNAGAHQHTLTNASDHRHSLSGVSVSLSGATANLSGTTASLSGASASLSNATASTFGESGTGKNMPPYMVVNKIIKLG